jgi:RNA polymerase sigma-70 factor (ECF subfamily)
MSDTVQPQRSAIVTESRCDEELVDAFRSAGDRAALGELIERYVAPLRRLIYTMLGGGMEAAMDAEQEVFSAMIRRIDRYRGASSFSTFFYRLARNRVLDLVRTRARVAGRVVPFHDSDLFAGAYPDPVSRLTDKETIRQVREAMLVLSPQDRFLLYMKDGEDHTIAELSQISGLPGNTVKSRLRRARIRVAARLEELGYESE